MWPLNRAGVGRKRPSSFYLRAAVLPANPARINLRSRLSICNKHVALRVKNPVFSNGTLTDIPCGPSQQRAPRRSSGISGIDRSCAESAARKPGTRRPASSRILRSIGGRTSHFLIRSKNIPSHLLRRIGPAGREGLSGAAGRLCSNAGLSCRVRGSCRHSRDKTDSLCFYRPHHTISLGADSDQTLSGLRRIVLDFNGPCGIIAPQETGLVGNDSPPI